MFSFFFFKQKTAYEMRISDWSSDVCSSDLVATRGQALLNRYWGGYVALTIGDDATLSVVRDPSGMMPCYVRRTPDGAILASDMPALAERGKVDVDHGALARPFAGFDTLGRRTGTRGFGELLPGERLSRLVGVGVGKEGVSTC